MIGIYYILSPSGKIYIGQSWSIEGRFSGYRALRCKGQHKLYASIKKYGTEKHKFIIAQTFEPSITQKYLDEWEAVWVKRLKYNGFQVLNIREGGSGGGKLAEETKIKISKAHTGKKHSAETLGKMAIAHRRENLSETTIKKMSKRMAGNTFSKGLKPTPETIEKNRIASAGRKHSEESKKKMSLAQMGNKKNLGQKRSEETKKKMSESAKAFSLKQKSKQFYKQ